jgi:N-acylneuraminate cytidylyltransferase
VLVSTDDKTIAKIARQYGAEVPFMRPSNLAQDDSLDLPVFQHALNWLAKNESYHPEIVVHLRPTSPLRQPDLVDRAVDVLFSNKDADSARGIVSSGQNPYKMWKLSSEGPMQPLLKVKRLDEPYNAPRQQLPPTFWQTGHIDAIRSSTILKKHSMSGEVIWPVIIDPRYTVDIDTGSDWRRAEWLAASGELDLVWPDKPPRAFPKDVRLLVLDFDGVLTDNRVWVNEEGREQIAANRSDGLGFKMLKETGIAAAVISMEQSPVVAKRCEKLGIPYRAGIENKQQVLKELIDENGLTSENVIYIGNDTNDLPCFPVAGFAVAVANSHPDVLRRADLRLNNKGGHGAVRELVDLILASKSKELE